MDGLTPRVASHDSQWHDTVCPRPADKPCRIGLGRMQLVRLP